MTMTMTLGKTRHLQKLTNKHGIFTMIAIDHHDTLIELIRQRQGGLEPTAEVITAEKERLARALASHASAILLDPIYSVESLIKQHIIPGRVGIMVAREASSYTDNDPGRETVLLADWNAAAIKRVGADGVKLLLYYHPDSSQAAYQENIVRQVAQECQEADIPFLLEPICYPIKPGQSKNDPDFAAERPEIVLESARRLAPLGVDVLKAEFPAAGQQFDDFTMRMYCRRLTELIGIPWVLLSAGVNFQNFQRQVKFACEEGASGFVVGRAIWQEAVETPDPDRRADYLNKIAVSRLRILADVANYRAKPAIDKPKLT